MIEVSILPDSPLLEEGKRLGDLVREYDIDIDHFHIPGMTSSTERKYRPEREVEERMRICFRAGERNWKNFMKI